MHMYTNKKKKKTSDLGKLASGDREVSPHWHLSHGESWGQWDPMDEGTLWGVVHGCWRMVYSS